jgi:predicted  nucleic acid-binding Zn-ribbon protein
VFVTGPATTPPSRGEEPAARRGTPERGEEYWRREAEKVRDRVRPLQEKADLLRARISDRQRKPGVRPFSDPGVRALQDELGRLLQRAREIEEGLEDRARRAGALPGWLR